jgi:LPS export ABC transporter protein LptC
MRLQRTALYRLSRIFSWILPLIVIGFIAIAAWSYRKRSGDVEANATRPQDLPRELDIISEHVTFRVSINGKDQYVVNADKMQRDKTNRSLLQKVAVTIFAKKEGDPDRNIYGDECTHDDVSKQMDCSRNVSVELEPGTIANTEHLFYDPATGRLSSDVQTALRRTGEMTGHAGKMDYFVDQGLMQLSGNFVIDLVQGGGMRGGAGVFQYKEHWATVTESVELISTNGRIYGGSGRSDLHPGTYRAKQITVEGGAAAEAPAFTVNSDWLHGDLADDGSIEHVLGRGSVRAERKSSQAGETEPLTGILTGAEVEAWLKDSLLQVVESRQASTFLSASAKLDAADKIRIEPSGQKAGSIRTNGKSVLDRDGLHIDGQNFSIDVKDDEQTFTTSSRATLKSAGLTTSGNTTNTRFDTKTKVLLFLHQTGNVTFQEDKGRSGSAANLLVLNGGDRIELEGGKPRFNDTEGSLDALKIFFDRKKETFTGDGSVRMTKPGKDRTTIILAGHVEGSADRIDYTRTVKMSPGDGSKVDTDHLTVYPKEKRFVADGNVRTSPPSGEHTVTAKHLEANESGQAHYTGDVVIEGTFEPPKSQRQKTDKKMSLELRTRDLDVESRNGDVETITAREGVDLTQGIRKGRGNRLEYNVITGDIWLVGTDTSEAEVREGPDRFTTGCSIHLKPDGSKDVKSCKDRSTTSSFPVKK